MLLGEIADSDRCRQHQPNGNHMKPMFAIFVCLLGLRLHFWRLNHTRSITRSQSSTCTSPGFHIYLTEVDQSVVKPSHFWSLSNDRKDKIRNPSRRSLGDDGWGAKTKQSCYFPGPCPATPEHENKDHGVDVKAYNRSVQWRPAGVMECRLWTFMV